MKADGALDRLRRCSDRLGEWRGGRGRRGFREREQQPCGTLSRLRSAVGLDCRKQRFPGASTRHGASIRGSQSSPTKIGQRIGATSATILSSHRERIASRRRLINSLVITYFDRALQPSRLLVALMFDKSCRVLPRPGNLPPRSSLHSLQQSMNHSRALYLSLFSRPFSLQLDTNVYRPV